MNHFTIRDIENLCGIKAHTLRIWEQRYKLFVPKRKESQHRVYDNDDLKELLRISFLYHSGHKISRIAALGPGEIERLVQASGIGDDNQEAFVHQLIEAGLDFDKERFEKIINTLVIRIGFEKTIVTILYPFLQRIGLLWMTNNVIPAQEHFASHIIRKKIILATDGLELPTKAMSNIIVFTPTGEFHEIPLLTANYFFRKYQNRTAYFGVNVAVESLEYYLQHHPATHLYAHVITQLCNEGLNNSIQMVSKKFPDKKIVLSGPVSQLLENTPPNLLVLRSVEELIAFAKETGTTSASHNS